MSRRPYRSALRQAQAEATRATVLDAAAGLFAHEGYLRTTMKDIASAADTSVETVYAQGSKSALLLACVDRALAGDDEQQPMLQRTEFTLALERPSAGEVIEAFVRALAHVAERAGGLVVAFEDAAAADGPTAALWVEAEQHRKADLRRLVQAVADRGGLRSGWDVDTATDAVWLTATPRAAHTALHSLGWSPERLVEAVTLQISALLIPSDERIPA